MSKDTENLMSALGAQAMRNSVNRMALPDSLKEIAKKNDQVNYWIHYYIDVISGFVGKNEADRLFHQYTNEAYTKVVSNSEYIISQLSNKADELRNAKVM